MPKAIWATSPAFISKARKKLKLKAQNLGSFVQLADGINDEICDYHLRSTDYSGWFRDVIKDDVLVRSSPAGGESQELSADESRKLIKSAINDRHTGSS